MSGLACDHDRSQFRLDQRLDIVLHLCGHIISLFRDPGTRHLFLQIGYFVYIIEIRSANIGILRYSLSYHHLTGLAFKSCLYRSSTYLISLGDIHAGGQMSGTALQSRQFNSSGFAAQLFNDQVRQIFARTG